MPEIVLKTILMKTPSVRAAILAIVKMLTARVALNQQTSALNQAVTPDRPWLDLAYQLAGIGLGVVPALLALHLLADQVGKQRQDALALGRGVGG